MPVLLEVVAQREVQERPARGGELHRGRQPALHDRQVAGREVPVQVGDEGTDLHPGRRAQRGRIDARPGHRDHAQAVDAPRGIGIARDDPPQQRLADAGPTDRDDHDPLVGLVAELAAELLAPLDRAASGRTRSRTR